MKELTCPICGSEDFIFPIGPRNAAIMIIGDKPTDNDIKYGKPFTEGSGTILRQEFAFRGIDTRQFRVTYLRSHISATKKLSPKCFEIDALDVIKEAKNKKLIILISAEVVKYFTSQSVENLMGLMTTSQLLSAPCFCMESLGSIFNRGGVVGEVRLSIQKISEYIKKEGLVK